MHVAKVMIWASSRRHWRITWKCLKMCVLATHPIKWGWSIQSGQKIQEKWSPISWQKWHHECGPLGSPFPLRSDLRMTCHVPGMASGPPILWTMVYNSGVIKSKKSFATVKLSLLLMSRFYIITSYPVCGLLKGVCVCWGWGGSLLLQVTLYEIFSILCASGCQIRLMWNTIIKTSASHT